MWWVTTLALLLAFSNLSASEHSVTPPMIGHWEGNARIIVNWCRQTKLPVVVDIRSDGSVSGKIGDALLTKGHLQSNRGWLGKKLNVKTDYIITGKLIGPIVVAEGITRSGVNIPLSFTGTTFVGGLHTSGSWFGGKKSMVLSATKLTLARRTSP